ncbi:MAG: zf-HC2 domain-containing protein [Gammaproteobacteria bacterium]|nr:zf-HC2 domain-containing protein [Gammaproteobacteria bacterium]
MHEEILELLPWFINETLGEKERDLVMVHLRECPECRKERDQLQGLEAFVKENDQVVPDYRFSYKQLLSRIEEAERNRESTAGLDEGLRTRNWMPFAGIAASLAFIVAIVGAFQPSVVPEVDSTGFRTLTTQTQTRGVSHRVALTFDQPIQALTMRKALIETRSNIVSGPDEEGIYVVEVEIPPEMTSEEYLQAMRKIEGVQYARFSE